MRRFVQNNALEKSDKVELGYYDYGQLYVTMSTVRANGDNQAKTYATVYLELDLFKI